MYTRTNNLLYTSALYNAPYYKCHYLIYKVDITTKSSMHLLREVVERAFKAVSSTREIQYEVRTLNL